jgi:hypothetical protein
VAAPLLPADPGRSGCADADVAPPGCQRASRLGAETAANGNGEAQSASIRTAASPTTVAATIETDAEGAVYPVIYVRRSGRIEERTLPGHPLHDFGPDGHRRALAALLGAVAVVAAEESSLQSGR